MLKLTIIRVGMLGVNCYAIWDEESHDALLFDPGSEAPTLLAKIKELDLKVRAMLLTHGHVDHIGALPDLWNALHVPLWLSPAERPLYLSPANELAPWLPHVENLPLPSATLPAIPGFDFQVIPTPGHTPGGVSYYFPKQKFVLTGDTLFAGAVGRTDLGGNADELRHSVMEVLFKLPDSTIVYPGHGAATTIGDEKPLQQW